jgi:hypothetical protein
LIKSKEQRMKMFSEKEETLKERKLREIETNIVVFGEFYLKFRLYFWSRFNFNNNNFFFETLNYIFQLRKP